MAIQKQLWATAAKVHFRDSGIGLTPRRIEVAIEAMP